MVSRCAATFSQDGCYLWSAGHLVGLGLLIIFLNAVLSFGVVFVLCFGCLHASRDLHDALVVLCMRALFSPAPGWREEFDMHEKDQENVTEGNKESREGGTVAVREKRKCSLVSLVQFTDLFHKDPLKNLKLQLGHFSYRQAEA
eukprot:3627722-Rhodomonas_salina.1